MIDAWAEWVFSGLCHQHAWRSWAPGGEPLALCERCLGVYAGAALMALVYPLARFKASRAWLLFHGALVLQVIPLGLHWLPHGPEIRTLSGQAFAIGTCWLMWRPFHEDGPLARQRISAGPYALALLLVAVLLQAAVRINWVPMAALMEALALAGAGVLVVTAVLLIGNVLSAGLSRKSARSAKAPEAV